MKRKELLGQVLRMPYYKNHAAASGAVHNIASHEDAFEDLLIAGGMNEHLKDTFLKKTKSKITKKERDSWRHTGIAVGMPPNSYISQPCGPNNSPDFIVKFGDGSIEFIECKSVKDASKQPMFNSGIPVETYLYVFCAEKYDETTLFYGQDVCPPQDYELFQKIISEHRKIDERYNPQFVNKFGLQHYTRPMVKHVGGTNYFKNPYRKEIEQRVLDGV